MNMKRFTARTSREALAMVKQTFGDDAIVMSTKPCAEGVEVLAMAPESLSALERVDAPRVAAPKPPEPPPAGGLMSTRFMRKLSQRDPVAPPVAPPAQSAPVRADRSAARSDVRAEPRFDSSSVEQDVNQMAMSTLSFQDYVRERMLKRRQAELEAQAQEQAPPPPSRVTPLRARTQGTAAPAAPKRPVPALATAPDEAPAPRPVPTLREEIRVPAPKPAAPSLPSLRLADAPSRREQDDTMMNELRSMRGLIEQRFGALAFMEKLQRQPRHATLTQRLLESGFSPTLVRRLADSLPDDGEPMAWAGTVLERNLAAGDSSPALEDLGGVYALIGATGVGKTTSTAKLAAAFAARHGAANLGLITLDAYRIGAHEQLRQYGRILGVPVHTAHDRASLEDLLELLAAKKMVLIDTAGMAQRDVRTRELLDMLSHPSIKRLLVLNAAAQGETFEDVVTAYGSTTCHGVILAKIDEAVKLGPALDVLIRHKLRVLAVGNGQRVPEDWHRLSSQALVQRALRAQAAPAWRFDAGDVNLVFAGVNHPVPGAVRTAAQGARPLHA